MKRLLIKKLIVISEVEKASKEIDFVSGLNIVIGGNKTGKSSLIKSIFHTLGCAVKYEDDWKKLINKYILMFQYGQNRYYLLRENKNFLLKRITDIGYTILCDTNVFEEYCSVIMTEFEVNIDLLTTKGKKISMTPPLLFRFQYIDQDMGWNKIGESFQNMKYVENWASSTNKYVVGFQGEEYYTARQELNLVKDKIEQTKVKLKHFNELLAAIEINFQNDNVISNIPKSTLTLNTLQIFDELNHLERQKVRLDDEIYKLKNSLYERNLQVSLIKNTVKELEADHNFAVKQDEVIACPLCGVIHNNSTIDRVEIVKDIQSGNQLLKQVRDEMKELNITLNELQISKVDCNMRYTKLKKDIENRQESASIVTTFRNEGKQDFIRSGSDEKVKIEMQLNSEEGEKSAIERRVKEFESRKRRSQITTDLIVYLEMLFKEVNIPLSTIKLSDFVQKLNKLGSDGPRIIYAYHCALYLYNLSRQQSPFNFLVIDTPNQQGQENMNLQNIDSVLKHLLDESGQVIIGTERVTGFEEKASNVITLKKVRNCLEKDKFTQHLEMFVDISMM